MSHLLSRPLSSAAPRARVDHRSPGERSTGRCAGPDMIRLLAPTQRTSGGTMLALDPTVVDAIWHAFAAYLPERGETAHPLGCHRPRISDRDCFEAIVFRLVTGCSWDVAGRLGKGSETTLRRRRDEWVACRRLVAPGRRGHRGLRQGDRARPLRRVARRLAAQGTLWRRGNRTEPDRPGQDRLEVVGRHRHQRGADRLGHRRREPQRLRPARPDPRRRRRAWTALRRRDAVARPGL